MIKDIVAEHEILKRPDNGIELEICPVKNRDCCTQNSRKIYCYGNSDFGKLLAVSSDNKGLRVANTVFTGDIEPDIQIRLIEQIVGKKIERSHTVLYARLAPDNIAV